MSFLKFMALISSSIINDASGKLGGSVFLKTKGGLALRANNGQTNPNSNLQQQVRAKQTVLLNKWRALSADEQAGWRDIAPDWSYVNKVGQTKTYSGYALFMKLNGQLFAKGGPGSPIGEVVDAPPGKPVQTDVGVSVTITTDGSEIDAFDVAWATAGLVTDALVIYATPPLSAGITNPSKSAYRWLGSVTDLTVPATFDAQSAYQQKYPTWTSGQKLGVKVMMLDTLTGYSTITEQLIRKVE